MDTLSGAITGTSVTVLKNGYDMYNLYKIDKKYNYPHNIRPSIIVRNYPLTLFRYGLYFPMASYWSEKGCPSFVAGSLAFVPYSLINLWYEGNPYYKFIGATSYLSTFDKASILTRVYTHSIAKCLVMGGTIYATQQQFNDHPYIGSMIAGSVGYVTSRPFYILNSYYTQKYMWKGIMPITYLRYAHHLWINRAFGFRQMTKSAVFYSVAYCMYTHVKKLLVYCC